MNLVRFVYRFSSPAVPVIDTTAFINQKGNYKSDCEAVADALHKYGAVVIKDPRVNDTHNNEFITMMEKYFEDRSQRFYNGEKVEDIFPNYAYQVGATPEFIEKAREHKAEVAKYKPGHKADTPQPPPYDAKWRFFWPMDDSGQNKADKDFNPPRFTPKDIPQWSNRMNSWGGMMVDGCKTVAQMAAIGMGLDQHVFSDKMKNGPHLLAPTGSDLVRYSEGTIFAGFHYDLNFLTIHGKSRYPGLFVWLRSGEKIPVAVPEGHLLLQAGIQFDLLTGGYVTCGYHEVVYNDAVKRRVEEAKAKGQSTWRVSSTLFSHINSEVILKPVRPFENSDPKYAPIRAYDQVMKELEAISLK